MANPTDIVDTTEGGRLTSSESTTLDTITVGKVPKKTATGFEDSDPYDPAAVAIEGGTIGGITVGVPNASGYVGASTTTAASAAGGSTAITLTADIGLAAGQGVLICGAGAVMSEGTCYEGTVVSCVGTALVVTPATTTTIPANYAVQRDNRTKTVGTTAPGTAVTLAADIQLLAGQGVFIAGAGAAGANYIGTVASCTGTALVVTPATSTSVSAGARVQHDDTAAIQASLDSLALTGGTILLPPGFYRCNRLTNMPGAGLAPLWLPQTQNPLSIEIVGSIPPAGLEGSPTPQWTGGASMIQSDCTGLAILGGYFGNNNLPWGPWTLVWLSLKNMMFRAYDDPNIGCLYGTWIGSVALDNVYCDTGAWLNNYTYPQTHAVTGVSMPGANCTPSQHIRSLFVSGYPLGLSAGEHTHIDYGFFFHCNTCFSVDSVSAFSADQIIVDVAGIAMLGVHGHVAIDSLRVDQCPTIISDAATGCTGYVNYVSGSGTILGGEQLHDLKTSALSASGIMAQHTYGNCDS